MMKKTTLCKLMVLAGFFLYLAPSNAQRNLALYNMPGLQQATYANPSFIPDASVVIGLPVISNINVGYGNSAFSLKDMGASGLRLRGIRLNYEKFLPFTEQDNIAAGGANTTLFAIGFRQKNQYFAFEASEHVVGNFYFPKAAVQFGADIDNGNYEPGQTYNLNGLAYDLTHFRNFSVTYAREFGRASAGVRLRYLVGLENYSSSGTGITLTATDAMDVYDVLGRLELWAAGVQSLSGQGSYPFGGQGNHGFAFDFGTTYELGEKLTASFSVVNVGGVEWSSGVRRKVIPAEFKSPGTEIDDTFHSFIYDAPSTNLSYNTTLPTLVYLGGAYQVNDKSSFNLLFNSRYNQSKHSLAVALSYSKKISRGLQASLTYSAINGSMLNLGGGIAAKAGPLQFYLVTDNLISAFSPTTFNNTHINVGVNLAFYQKPKTPVALADTATLAYPADTMAIAAAEQARPDGNDLQPAAPPQGQPRPNTTQPTAPPQGQPRPNTTQPQQPQGQPRPNTTQPAAPPQGQPRPNTTQPQQPQGQPRPNTTQPAAPPQGQPRPNTAQPQQQEPQRTNPAQPPAPRQERPAENATPPPRPAPAPERAPDASPASYAVLQGAIHLENRAEKVTHYYFDVYKIHPDGRRELVRTGRMPNGDYKLYLDQAYDHEITFRHSESAPLVIKIDSEDLKNAGPGITRNIILQRAEDFPARPQPRSQGTAAPPAGEEEQEVEDLMELSVPELQQEEAEVIQRRVPQEEPAELWVDQPARSFQLKRDISIYKDMDANSRVIARLSVGMEIEVLERTTAEWWMVAYRSKIGWAEASQLK